MCCLVASAMGGSVLKPSDNATITRLTPNTQKFVKEHKCKMSRSIFMIANIVQEQELVPMERITVRVNAVQNSTKYQFGEDEINLD